MSLSSADTFPTVVFTGSFSVASNGPKVWKMVAFHNEHFYNAAFITEQLNYKSQNRPSTALSNKTLKSLTVIKRGVLSFISRTLTSTVPKSIYGTVPWSRAMTIS